MIVRKNLRLRVVFYFTGHYILWLTLWISSITAIYYYTGFKWFTIPWLPLSVIGTAVAFYVGFKNNQSYGRLWEARKIWGAIVNSNRMLASNVYATLGSTYPEEAKKLIYQNIGWCYVIRKQLLQSMQWEHSPNSGSSLRQKFGNGLFNEDIEDYSDKYLSTLNQEKYNAFSNKACYILNEQTDTIQKLYDDNKIEWFKQVEIQRIVNDFYDHQGKLERIKRFPLPRQYGSYSLIFVCIFIFLLPFGLLGEFQKFDKEIFWLVIPVGVVVGWIYLVMEFVGDYSENPFEGMPNDIPMLSICRSIEIDLLTILGETDLPEPVTPKNDVLM